MEDTEREERDALKCRPILFAMVFMIIILCCATGYGEDYPINATLFSPNLMASSFNTSINRYYDEFIKESSYSTIYSDLYLSKDYINSDDEKVIYSNVYNTFSLTFYCKNEFSYAEKVIIEADTSSLNKWGNWPIIFYAALIDDTGMDENGYWTTFVYDWAKEGNHYSPYYAATFTTKYTTVGFKHTIEMTATTHLTYSCEACAPTYTQAGWKEYWRCLSCDKLFADSDGLWQIYEPIPIPPLNELSILYLPEDIEAIEAEAFSNTDCEAVIIPEGCITIGEKAFADCKNLLYLRLPSSIETVAEDAFDGCDNATVFIVVNEE